jgi:phytoene/squalene synthetase
MSAGRRSTFYWAMRLMPARQRAAMFAVYGWCRAVDDIADADLPAEIRRAGLAAARRDLDRLFAGEERSALGEAVRAYAIERKWFDMVLDGLDTDVSAPLQAPEMAALELYCRRVAGAVGGMAVAIFGLSGSTAEAFAFAAGSALQLTNILRDVGEDAARGRLYLPREALAHAGIAGTDPAAVLTDPRLPTAKAWLAERAVAEYERAEALAARLDRRRLWPGLAMLRLYRRLLDRLPAEERPRLGAIEALGVVLASRLGFPR